MTTTPTTYRLVRPDVAVDVPTLDEHQQRVVDHPGGPLLVLAGPGTGKTTTLVETIVDRIEHRGARPDEILALTFSRKAAEQLRDRVTARLGRTMSTTLSSTFHSFAYALIRRYAPAELYEAPLRLLSAPEQDVVLRELLTDHPESVRWPDSLSRALGTRGFAREVHAVLSRAREKGLDGEELRALGEAEGVPEFVAAGLFLDQYLDSLDSQGAIDYADLIRRATIEAEVHRDELRARLRHVFVDEYQDTDPGQVALLRALAGDGRDLTVVGDPHQSIYGFRGAEVRGILDFPTEFPRADGAPADVVALRATRRFGPRVLVASQRLAHRLALPGSIPLEARQAFLDPQAVSGPLGDGRVVVRTFDTERAEAEHLADLLRRAHLEDGIAWDDMAVLVRSGRTSIPPLRRALGAAGVPVEVASDEVPLVRDPAVLPLLDGLRAVVNLDAPQLKGGVENVDYLDAARAEALLLGPLGGLDAGDVRRLGRQLRALEKEQSKAEDRPPRTSRELVRAAVVEPGCLDGLPGPEVVRARALAQLLVDARADLASGASAEELLWMLWSRTGWPARLRRSVDLGGGAARRAHRDLDSVCALFEVAARAEEQRDHVGVRAFLATLVQQQIPADTLADRGARGAAVRLLTAHRSKGLEWRLVVVAHVQQEGWPDLRRRSTLLQADRIGEDGIVPPVSPRELLMEERRLFYVACTRARQRLVVTAVASAEDDGEQPSRFLDELGVTVEKVVGRPLRPLSMAGLVSELRRTLADPATSEPLRDAAARRLARLAGESVGERALVPSADPATWWGTRAASRSVQPVRDPDQPVPVSASILESLGVCPTQWFLEREAGGVARAHQSANLGELLHALAQRVAAGEIDTGGDVDTGVEILMTHVDAVWDRLDFRTPWSKAREHERVRAALGRFLRWHVANPRRLLETEAKFETVVELEDGERVTLSGYADRIELDADGNVVVVDLKTGRTKPSTKSVESHVQLGLYQYAVDHGAVDELTGGEAHAGGAELVQLGILDGGPEAVVQSQAAQPEDGPDRELLRDRLRHTASLLRAEEFPAVAGQHCRECSFVPICPIKGAGSVTSQ
ncbi:MULTISPECIES: ATP-dependent helicase [unclassified Nocardioides]|uniref:ATP-dependent helicase n=1 Tax=unclassified Nocardioides TaxID=2615069 RepID=UPI0009F10916|nr:MULTISPECIES: ATP-dependent DNA helicase [unclassified Nocardioides]GAW49577.1 UvrD/REP helicase [Nocardioides sp. PD653-B2]GAW57311.1 UvrD/REP helicase [Nocardioides sp. PD653]